MNFIEILEEMKKFSEKQVKKETKDNLGYGIIGVAVYPNGECNSFIMGNMKLPQVVLMSKELKKRLKELDKRIKIEIKKFSKEAEKKLINKFNIGS